MHGPAGQARSVSRTEPTMADWRAGAEIYNITLTAAVPGPTLGDFTLAIDYVGDAARLYYGGRLLTDNWYSGYSGEGAMEVGLNYLAEENPGLLEAGATLSLWILPLKQSDLKQHIYLQKRLWPTFPAGEDSVVLQLNSVKMAGLIYTDLTLE